MGHHRHAVAIGACDIFLAIAFSSSLLFAEGKSPFSLQARLKAFYVSGIQDHDFAGTNYLESDTELFLVPKIKGNYSFGGMLGGRFDLGSSFFQAVGLELGYRSSSHKYSFMDAESESTTASFKSYFCILRAYFLKKKFVQPFAYLSLGSSQLIVKNGSYSYTPPLRVGDATYGGTEYGLGIGAALYLPANFVLNAAAGYHVLLMKNVTGILGTKYDTEAIRGTYPLFSVGLGYSFKLGRS